MKFRNARDAFEDATNTETALLGNDIQAGIATILRFGCPCKVYDRRGWVPSANTAPFDGRSYSLHPDAETGYHQSCAKKTYNDNMRNVASLCPSDSYFGVATSMWRDALLNLVNMATWFL